MKKTLVALAALAATGAFAQSSVTLYGIVDLGYGTNTVTARNGTTMGKTTGGLEGTWAGNRVGFRGTEDLGGGMKASFVLEQGLSPQSGDLFGARAAASGFQGNNAFATPIATATGPTLALNTAAATSALYQGGTGMSATSLNRQSFASLSGGFGEVRVGYQYTHAYQLSSLSGYIYGPEISGGDVAHQVGQAAVGGARANGFTYIAPTFVPGLTVSVQYGSGAAGANINLTTATEVSNKRTGVMAKYDNGPLSVAFATTQNKQTLAATSVSASLNQFAAKYDFGVAALRGTYTKGKTGFGANATAATADGIKGTQVTVTVPFGAATAFLATGKATYDNATLGNFSDIKQSQIGATYSLSKRTTLYFVNGTTKDEGTNVAAGTASKGSTTRVGVNHTF